MKFFRKHPILLSIPLALGMNGMAAGSAAARDGTIRDIGDVLQFALPASALASTFIADDPEGRVQWLYSQGTTGILVGAGKLYFEKLRPRGGSRTSFPSGHTAAATSGAAFMGTRYGPWVGVPAYALAGFTAYSRVWADAHFANDVVGGFGLAFLTNMALVNPRDENVIVTPAILGDDTPGIQFTLLGLGDEESSVERQRRKNADFTPDFRFRFDFGAAHLMENTIQSPKGGGTAFDLDSFNKQDDPTVVSTAHVDFFIDQNQSITAAYTPFESRDKGRFSSPTNFNNVNFPADTDIKSQYRLHEIRAYYNYSFDTDPEWDVVLGGGVHFSNTVVNLEQVSNGMQTEVEANLILPVLRLGVGYQFAEDFSIRADLDGIVTPEDTMVEATVGVRYDISPRWEAELYAGFASRDYETSELKNKYDYAIWGVSFAYKL